MTFSRVTKRLEDKVFKRIVARFVPTVGLLVKLADKDPCANCILRKTDYADGGLFLEN